MTIAPKSASSETGLPTSVANLIHQDVSALEAIFRMDDFGGADAKWSPFLPFMSWLISSTKPGVTADLGFEGGPSFHAICQAAQNLESPTRCIAVLLAAPGQTGDEREQVVRQFNVLLSDSATQFGSMVKGIVEAEQFFTAEVPQIDLLHLSLSKEGGRSPNYLQNWIERMVPGAVFVVTSTNSGSGSEYTATRRYVADQLPSTVISLGPTTEVFVAQIPVEGTTPLIDLLDNAPAAVRRLFTLFAERSAYRHVLGSDPASPSDVTAFIDSLKEARQTEREAFKVALEATRETIATLARQSAMLKSELLEFKDRASRELVEQREQAQVEMELMRTEYFGRLDELTARLSTSAARHARELTSMELALEGREHEAEVLAGEAAEARRRIDELLGSSSWRMTAPVRLLSRLVGPRAKGPSQRPH